MSSVILLAVHSMKKTKQNRFIRIKRKTRLKFLKSVSLLSCPDKNGVFLFFLVLRKGEDTFGDSESEEDDVVVGGDSNGDGGMLSPGALSAPVAARPRLGLGASLASMVHNRGGPTCTLEDHPIQVCMSHNTSKDVRIVL